MAEHVIITAIVVEGDQHDREEAERYLHDQLKGVQARSDRVACWWIAEDDRHDGSNTDSAVFVKLGRQEDANRVLEGTGLAWKPL